MTTSQAQDIDLDNIDLSELRHKFRSTSKYLEQWLRLKYTLHLEIETPNIRGKHRAIQKGFRNLKRHDLYFRQFCILQYGIELNLNAFSRDSKTLILQLNHPDKKLVDNFK